VDTVLGTASDLSEERGASLGVRITNEKQLLAKANQKPLFGWGGWSRNRIFDVWESKDISVTDGGWIIFLGVFGWFGYLGLFGMFALPVLRLNAFVKRADPQDAMAAAGIALMLAANIADMIPNANLTPITFLLAGSIGRRLALRRVPSRIAAADAQLAHRPEPAAELVD
jgi:hypothetical protein